MTGRGVVPGTIIQRYLEGELVATPRAQLEIPVTVASRGNDEGLLVVGDPPVLEIPLSKGPWRLVQTLFNARGGTVAIEDLQKRLELDSPKPLYSIIQRLDQKAKGSSSGAFHRERPGTRVPPEQSPPLEDLKVKIASRRLLKKLVRRVLAFLMRLVHQHEGRTQEERLF